MGVMVGVGTKPSGTDVSSAKRHRLDALHDEQWPERRTSEECICRAEKWRHMMVEQQCSMMGSLTVVKEGVQRGKVVCGVRVCQRIE